MFILPPQPYPFDDLPEPLEELLWEQEDQDLTVYLAMLVMWEREMRV